MFVGHYILQLVMVELWRYATEHDPPTRSLSSVLGIVERGLYTVALVVGGPQWIGVWLAIKVIARWQRSEREGVSATRAIDNIWLIGTGLSVLFGFLGACLALWGLPVLALP